MTAYYNEFDPFAAAWLRELIKASHIAPGDVDERSIADVRPSDLRGYTQCHFFAGIGVWSYALRRAGWPDSRPVWTGSCPCQPFSAAGKGGGFDDERHLWPHFHHLIRLCRPAVVAGEQVASKDGLGWCDLVQTDLEGEGYAFGAVDTCSAGFGAPHTRQRLWWLAERLADVPRGGRREERADVGRGPAGDRAQGFAAGFGTGRGAGGLDDDDDARLEGQRRGHQAESGRNGQVRPVAETGEPDWLADDDRTGRQPRPELRPLRPEHDAEHGDATRIERTGPTNGHWRDADWLFCRDGKWRPVEPGTFPLAHGAPARVGRLRGYGNAINAEAATAFIEAYLDRDTIEIEGA